MTEAADGWSSPRQELRDLWLGGRGLLLAFAFSVLLSAITYLGATNEALNFLERREAVNLTLQVAVGRRRPAGPARRGRRDQRRARARHAREPAAHARRSRAALVAGKLLAALSLWLGALVVTVPYVWFLGHDVGAAGEAIGDRARSPARCSRSG